ncbi:MAG: SoxR reducing system RseC family protein [Candidatus Competibacteraceae bacterium]|nr:SoxR reducing system RseC family protein [Candidatus Competibacteraceae bacterium]
MIQEQARVVAIGEGYAWVETQRQTSCGACSANKGCGTAALAKVLGQRRTHIYALTQIPLKVGDEVIIGIAEQALLQSSLAVYLVPLLTFFTGAVLGRVIFSFDSEPMIITFGLLGLIVGFVWLWFFNRQIRADNRFQPLILGHTSL